MISSVQSLRKVSEPSKEDGGKWENCLLLVKLNGNVFDHLYQFYVSYVHIYMYIPCGIAFVSDKTFV